MPAAVTVTRPLFARLLRDMLRRGRAAVCRAGLSRYGDVRELLLCSDEAPTLPRFVMLSADGPEAGIPRDAGGGLLWSAGGAGLRGWAIDGALVREVDVVRLVGPGMHRVPLSRAARAAERSPAVPERWSRTAGALGAAAWQRLTGLHYVAVGAGRSGSALAEQLARLGAERLTLIDADHLEQANLGEMTAVGEESVGRPKAEALADALAGPFAAASAVQPLTRSVTNVRSLHAVQRGDVVVSSVDQDGARLTAACLAALFLKPHLDVGVGVHGRGGGRRMGFDVRLCVPGECCLLCLGGLADAEGARAFVRSAEAEAEASRGRVWHAERAGSVRSLNLLAAALAVRLWEDFVAERVAGSVWLHGEIGPAGRLTVSYPLPAADPACRLCRLAGQGEGGLTGVAAV